MDYVLTRMNDAMAANQLLTWKAGEDQARLHADYLCDMRPKNANVFDMWKGRAIMEQVRQEHFSGTRSAMIRAAYKQFCEDPRWRRAILAQSDPDADFTSPVSSSRRR